MNTTAILKKKKMSSKKNKVLVFGAFDGLHEGHLYFLRKAKKSGKLIVCVAQDSTILRLKGREPNSSLQGRTRLLRATKIPHLVVAGDKILGRWGAVKKLKPDIVAFGYDQSRLKSAFEKSFPKFPTKKIRAFKPKKFHTSILKRT